MPKKDGRGRISDMEIKHIRKLKQKGHSTSEIAEMTGWGIRTVRDAVSGAIYAQREKAKQRYADKKSLIEACEQTQTTLEGMMGGLVGPKMAQEIVKAREPDEAPLPEFTDTPSPIAQFLMDVAAAMTKLAEGLGR